MYNKKGILANVRGKSYMKIKKITAQETWELRHAVMWPTKNIEYVKLKDDEQGTHYGAFIDNILLSVISLFYQGTQVQFRKFATCTEKQKQGYGTKLLEYVLTEAKNMGAEKIWCHARTNKVNFYERFGLQVVGETFERDGKMYVCMSKELI